MEDYEKAVALWQSKNIASDAQLAEILNGQSVSFAYHSGKIENDKITYNDTREIFDHNGVTSYTGDVRTLFKISNAKDAYGFFLTAFNEKRPLDEGFIKELHRELTKSTYDTRSRQLGERPGEYKIHDYVTGKDEIGALPEDVAEEMNELLEELRNVKDEDALTAAAYFHSKFENIHPFADGNGRCGRLALNYFFILHTHPPVMIHEEDRKAYYAALEAWDTTQELKPMCNYLKEQTAKTWEKQIERVERKTSRNR